MAKRIIINNKSDLEEKYVVIKLKEFLCDDKIRDEIYAWGSNLISFGEYVCYAKLNNSGSLTFTFYNANIK